MKSRFHTFITNHSSLVWQPASFSDSAPPSTTGISQTKPVAKTIRPGWSNQTKLKSSIYRDMFSKYLAKKVENDPENPLTLTSGLQFHSVRDRKRGWIERRWTFTGFYSSCHNWHCLFLMQSLGKKHKKTKLRLKTLCIKQNGANGWIEWCHEHGSTSSPVPASSCLLARRSACMSASLEFW